MSLAQLLGCLHVGECAGQCVQVCEGHALAQEGCRIAQTGQLIQRGHRVLGAVHPLDASGLLCIGHLGGEQARSMEVQERVEVLRTVGVEASGVALRDVALMRLMLLFYSMVAGEQLSARRRYEEQIFF